jgi:hypothetical protein
MNFLPELETSHIEYDVESGKSWSSCWQQKPHDSSLFLLLPDFGIWLRKWTHSSNQTAQLLLQLSFFPGHISSFWDDGGGNVVLPSTKVARSFHIKPNEEFSIETLLNSSSSHQNPSASHGIQWGSGYTTACSVESDNTKATSNMILVSLWKISLPRSLLQGFFRCLRVWKKGRLLEFLFLSRLNWVCCLSTWTIINLRNWRNGRWQQYFT